MMRTKMIKRLTILIAFCSLIFVFGCNNPFSSPASIDASKEMPEGMGSFVLRIADSSERTIKPKIEPDKFELYKLEFYEHDSERTETYEINKTDLNENIFHLLPGTYNLTIIAYVDTEGQKPAASGILNNVEINAGKEAIGEIVLNMFSFGERDGKGIFSWNIEFDGNLFNELNEVSINIRSLPINTENDGITLYIIGETEEVIGKSGRIDIETGNYLVTFTLTKTDEKYRPAKWLETLQVYNNLESNYSHTFNNDIFIRGTYVVTFRCYERNIILSEISLNHMDPIGQAIEAPSGEDNYADHEFTGWYTEEGVLFTEWNTPLFKDTNLYARWIPVMGGSAAITGTNRIGDMLTVNTNSVIIGGKTIPTPLPDGYFNYQWQASGVNINEGAAGKIYTVKPGDVGKVITCVITRPNVSGSITAVISGNPEVPYTIRIIEIGNKAEGDAISVDKYYGAEDELIKLTYSVANTAGINRLSFNIPEIHAVSAAVSNGTQDYIVNSDDADSDTGVITIEADFYHTNKTYIGLYFNDGNDTIHINYGSAATFTNLICNTAGCTDHGGGYQVHPQYSNIAYSITLSTPDDVASINSATGIVTINRAGSVTIRARIPEDIQYAETHKDYTLTIEPIQLLWNASGTVKGKTYDGTTAAEIDTLPGLTGVLSGETVNESAGTVAFYSANVSLSGAVPQVIPVTASGWGITGKHSYNYTAPIQQPLFAGAVISKAIGWGVGEPYAVTAEITSYSITIFSVNRISPEENPQPFNDQTVEYNIKKGGTGDYMLENWQPGLIFTDLDPATMYKVYARSAASNNYTIGQVSESNAITTNKLHLTVTDFVYTNVTKEYNALSEPVSVDYRSGITAAQAGDITVWYSGANYAHNTAIPVSVGAYNVTVTTSGGTLYGAETNNTLLQLGTYIITPIHLTITPLSGQSKIYGEADPLLQYNDRSSELLDDHYFEGKLSRAAGENVSPRQINIGDLRIVHGNGDLCPSYTLAVNVIPAPVNFTITPKQLEWDIGTAQKPATVNTKTYDGTTNATVNLLPTLSGVFANHTVNGVTLNDDVTVNVTAAFNSIYVGTSVNVTAAANYSINDGRTTPNYTRPVDTPVFAPTEITRRSFTITPTSNQQRRYDEPNPAVYQSAVTNVAAGDQANIVLLHDGTINQYGRTDVGQYNLVLDSFTIMRGAEDVTYCYDENPTFAAGVKYTIIKANGGIVGVPSLASRAISSITLNTLTVNNSEQSAEYGMSSSQNTSPANWQDSETFGPLSPGTSYYFFARSKESNNYLTGSQIPLNPPGIMIMTATVQQLEITFTPITNPATLNMELPLGVNLDNLQISLSAKNTITLALQNIAGPFEWRVNDQLQVNTTNSFTLSWANFNRTHVGFIHNLYVEVFVGGIPYSLTIPFMVIE